MTIAEIFPSLNAKQRTRLGVALKDKINPLRKIEETHTFLVNDYDIKDIESITLIAIELFKKKEEVSNE